MQNIKSIIFDYGGTLDTGGRHWFDVIFRACRHSGVEVSRENLYKAYVFAERQLAVPGRVGIDMSFHDLVVLKIQIELGWLANEGQISWDEAEQGVAMTVAECVNVAERSIEAVKPHLERLATKYPLAMASNFYGNLDCVLRQNGLRGCFQSVLDSATVGVRKPGPAIFRMGCIALGSKPCETLVVGDSVKNDILPALEIGCPTVLLAPDGKVAVKEAYPDLDLSQTHIVKSIAEINL